LPYLYSWIWAVHPSSLIAMRMLSAACGGLKCCFSASPWFLPSDFPLKLHSQPSPRFCSIRTQSRGM
jgi:hypothetical protein